jgi:hypothetical protein
MKFNIGSLADVLLETPPIQEGTYIFQIRKAEIKTNKKDKQMLNLTLGFQDDELIDHSTQEVINNKAHNATVFDSILLEPTGDLTQDMINNKLARFVDAVYRDKTAHKEIDALVTEDYEGKFVKCVLKHEPEKDGYPAKNRINGYYMITDSDEFNEPVC